MNKTLTNLIARPYFWLAVLLPPSPASAEFTHWSYSQERDTLTNSSYSLARSPMPERGKYDNIRLEIVCKDQKLLFVVNGNTLIASPDRPFTVDYQIDQRPPVSLTLRTFADSKQRGYTDTDVQAIVTDLLSGQSVFVRVNTFIRRVLTGAMTLENSAPPIHQVLADCGADAPRATSEDYSLADFQEDFKQLDAAHQQRLLAKIKQWLRESP